jgi:uncharacterized damage-inducible protein DinB
MHPRLAELTEHLAQQHRALLDVASSVPSDSWQARPGEGQWSVSEILEHLHRVDRSVTGLLTKKIAAAREAGHPEESETSSVLGTLDQFRVSEVGDRKLVAPETVAPTENPDRETVERKLAESRAALNTAIASGDGLALGSITHTNSRFGELDLYQWILFVAGHEKRHTAQLREVARQLVPTS